MFLILALAAMPGGCSQTPSPTTVTITSPSVASPTVTPPSTTAITTAKPSPTTASTSTPPAVVATLAVDSSPIVQKMNQAAAAVQSYRIEREISSAKSTKEDKSDQTTVSVSSQAVLDLKSRRMQMNNKNYMKLATGQMASTVIETAIYIVNDTMYIQGFFQDTPQAWSKTTLNDQLWQRQNQIPQLSALLSNQKASSAGTEKVKASDKEYLCDLIVIKPEPKALWSLLLSQPGVEIPAEAPAGVALSDIIPSSEAKIWIDQASGLPVKTFVKVSVRVTPAQVKTLASTVTMDITLSLQFSDYNKSFDIQLPAEAAASDVPDLKDVQKQTATP